MPPICRFYLKGYCRYGSSCKFEHPGEHKGGGGAADSFSFTKALEETSGATNFSFTKALEETTYSRFNQQPDPYYNSTPYFNANQQTNPPGGLFNQNNSLYGHNQTVFNNSPFHQQYNNNNNNNFGNFNKYNNNDTLSSFSFAKAASNLQPTSPFNSFNNTAASTFYQAPNTQLFQPTVQPTTGFPSEQVQPKIDLTELELKAYQSDKFQFRMIPVRPPPSSLCF